VSAAPVHRVHHRPPRHRWPGRVLGLLATAALLGVGGWSAAQVVPGGDGATALVDAVPPAASAVPSGTETGGDAKPAEPKLTRAERHERNAAAAVLRDRGYRAVTLSAYDPSHVLRVLIGRGDAGQRAFFFAGGNYLGNDALSDSARVRLVRSGKKSVTLSYRLFSAGDEACCPTGGRVQVRFRWDGKKLSTDNAIPPASFRLAPA
jgi:hypothetical protein